MFSILEPVLDPRTCSRSSNLFSFFRFFYTPPVHRALLMLELAQQFGRVPHAGEAIIVLGPGPALEYGDRLAQQPADAVWYSWCSHG
ncbi:MAG: hypothetical protein M0R28_18165 [Pigmentiphaga sp.]|nr:hypothetical protein [Pigmentiphaga sp.]